MSADNGKYVNIRLAYAVPAVVMSFLNIIISVRGAKRDMHYMGTV